ncbi:PREDICTED: transcription initiation factor TFIID subunit 11-like [Tarenaya hassleriana]|uniref:transcription initiation factor TFIID subunit 11-like n=1 Tax=Tarenaya hassleriana TaxID=28532 RepID=UPI00053C30E2|nr:PREDICTED: transcription initiation factor TFIID subunit 11-like [Tarenaya hassleriana]
MKQPIDPFEAAWREYEESLREKPVVDGDVGGGDGSRTSIKKIPAEDDTAAGDLRPSKKSKTSMEGLGENKDDEDDDDDEEEEETADVDFTKRPFSGDTSTADKMQDVFSQFTGDQMNRYESYRRSAFQRSSMKRLLTSITGTQTINLQITIVMCSIAKMFVGDLVEKARTVMGERKDSGPIRPCHIREAYRRLKLEGKVPKGAVPRLLR